MTDFDIAGAFEGLDSDTARELRNRIEQSVRGVIAEYRQAAKPQAQTFDAESTDAELGRLSTQYQQLAKFPGQGNNRQRMSEIAAQLDTLTNQVQQHQAAQGRPDPEQVHQQTATLTQELQPLVEEAQRLQKFPSKHRERLKEISSQIESKSRQLEALQ